MIATGQKASLLSLRSEQADMDRSIIVDEGGSRHAVASHPYILPERERMVDFKVPSPQALQ